MIFLGFTTKKAKKAHLKQIEDLGIERKKEIDKKLIEVKESTKELASMIADTKKISSTIQEKLNKKLKITNNTIKTICHTLRESVIIVNYQGEVLEINPAFENRFSVQRNDTLGIKFIDLMKKINVNSISIADNFFINLSEDIFKKIEIKFNSGCKKDCISCNADCNNNLNINKIMIDIQPSGFVNSIPCEINMTVIDNSPSKVEDLSFILFFNCLKRINDVS